MTETSWLEQYRQFWESRFRRLDAVLAGLKTKHKKTRTRDLAEKT